MGRRDAVQVTLEIVAECRRLLPGLLVTYEPGWETRGNGLSANYVGGIVHHTASVSSATRPFPTQTILRDGRSDLPGPLCNFAGPWCSVEMPRLHVMAAFPANHAGASGGRSMGPLPRTGLFNPVVVGLEIDYAGTSPMTAGQLMVGKVWTRAVANVLAGGNVEWIRAHMETSVTGKFDIGYAPGRTYDMAGWRRDAATIAAPTPPAPILEDDDMPQVITHTIESGKDLVIPIPPVNEGGAGWGPAWASLVVDMFEQKARPIAVRVGIMGKDRKYRPMFGATFDLMIAPGTRPSMQLANGDQAIVVTNLDTEGGVGLMVEYARR